MKWTPNPENAIGLEAAWETELLPMLRMETKGNDDLCNTLHKMFIAGAMAAMRALANGIPWSDLRAEIVSHAEKVD